jgi:hypothetical protein
VIIDFEVDFASAIQRKAEIIRKCKPLSDLVRADRTPGQREREARLQAARNGTPYTASPTATTAAAAPTEGKSRAKKASQDYHMVGADLRDVKELEAMLIANGVDFSLPTLFLSECVLVYMKPEDSAV